jgi:Outer membrane protein beta-barrel domain
MKKITMALFALALVSVVNAQNETAEKIMKKYRFGLHANIGSSSLNPVSGTAKLANDSNTYTVSNGGGKIAFGFGLSAEKPLTESVTVYSGLNLDWYGGKVNSDATGAYNANAIYAKTAKANYSLQSIGLPLGLKLKAAEIKNKILIFAQLGADVSFIIGRKADVDMTYDFSPTTGSANAPKSTTGKLDFKTVTPTQIGWHFGAGAEYKLNAKNSVYGLILYRNNLIDATLPQYRTDADIKFADGNVRGNNISLRIGYFF